MKEEKEELIKSIFNLMTDREKDIFYQLDSDNIHFLKEIGKFHDNIDLVVKAKGVLKKERFKKKALKKLKESSKEIYMTVKPSVETYVFHLLLDCIIRIGYLLEYKSKISEGGENKNIKLWSFKVKKSILKKSKSIDTRCSNFLSSIIKYNDMVINNDILEKQISDSKNTGTSN
ncbi:hypothetical protein NRK67_03850 [Fusobacteria bacterium ZRK30]|nr:hypothetical protein NRK67_03850 [Fusobacteria bacterium ZRK30]